MHCDFLGTEPETDDLRYCTVGTPLSQPTNQPAML